MPRQKKRFQITSTAPGGRITQMHSTDEVIEAWDYYAYFTKKAPLNEVVIVDRAEEVEASA